jgi:hypothetical protein
LKCTPCLGFRLRTARDWWHRQLCFRLWIFHDLVVAPCDVSLEALGALGSAGLSFWSFVLNWSLMRQPLRSENRLIIPRIVEVSIRLTMISPHCHFFPHPSCEVALQRIRQYPVNEDISLCCPMAISFRSIKARSGGYIPPFQSEFLNVRGYKHSFENFTRFLLLLTQPLSITLVRV